MLEDNKCKKCGCELDKDYDFCPNCGAPLKKKESSWKQKIKKFVVGYLILSVIVYVVFMLFVGGEEGTEKSPVKISYEEYLDILSGEEVSDEYLENEVTLTANFLRYTDESSEQKIDYEFKDDEIYFIYDDLEKVADEMGYFKTDDPSVLKDIGCGSSIQLTGTIENINDSTLLKAKEIKVKESKTIDEGNEIFNKTAEKIDDSKEDKQTGPIEATVDEVLANPNQYVGKQVKLICSLPQALVLSPDGREICAVNSITDMNKMIEVIGGKPQIGNCKGEVTGTIAINQGTPVIEAYIFACTEAYSVPGSSNETNSYYSYQPDEPYYVQHYYVNYDMAIRSDHYKDSPKLGTVIKAGTIVSVYDCKGGTGYSIWGKLIDGSWICIEDESYCYLTQID
ncbi:MAG: zinc-ribbon domain-containing protein [Floccifex sp.]